jgi:hypothetical protein
MGLLDDAIREHLDLKRRRGADPTEVQRAEREALGPVRRNREPADSSEPAEAAAAEGGFAYDQSDEQGDEQDWAHDFVQEPTADVPAEAPSDHAPPPHAFEDDDFDAPEESQSSAVRGPVHGAPFDSAADDVAPPPREWAPEERRPAQRFRPDSSPQRPVSQVSDETAEYRVQDALGEDEEGDDMLEETPEFLQDTPDHDRLWFEQRPPRDFDFDG